MPSTPKGRNEKGQCRNKHASLKHAVRAMVSVGSADDVLDMFAGDGLMYRHHWARAGRGATMDLEPHLVDRAARERRGWSIVETNAQRALKAGIWAEREFSIIDVDCFGEPCPFLVALFHGRRSLAPSCTLILTDHYMGNRNLSHESLTLGFRKPGSGEEYLACMDRLLTRLLMPIGYDFRRQLYRDGKAVQHLVTLTRLAG
jgi:hypothetical protein